LIVRTTDEALSTLPVDGTTYSVGGTIGSGRGQGTVIYNGKVFTASSSLPERDHVYYYYFFPHDGTPNYNVQEARGELDLRYPTVSVSGIWLTTASSAGSPFGSRLTRAEPGTWITITGEGFTNLGGTVNFVSGETIAYSYASGDSVIGSGWWEDVDGTGHVNFMIPTDVAYGTYDIQVVNYYSKVGTVEDFAIIPDDSITGRPLLTTIYANTGPSTWQVTTEAHVCDLIKITGTNIGSGAWFFFNRSAGICSYG
jgi:hypothetical protein